MDKSLIRQEMRKKRRNASPDERQKSSLRATDFFLNHPLFLNHQKIAVYVSTPDEMDTHFVIEKILASKGECYLPIIDRPEKGQLSFVRVEHMNSLQWNRCHILEPPWDPAKSMALENLDLVIVPVVAFDASGTRLGMGGGYYDHAFQFLNKVQRPAQPFLCGWAYHFQEYAPLPKESWDIRLDAIITDQYFLNCSSLDQKGKKEFYEV